VPPDDYRHEHSHTNSGTEHRTDKSQSESRRVFEPRQLPLNQQTASVFWRARFAGSYLVRSLGRTAWSCGRPASAWCGQKAGDGGRRLARDLPLQRHCRLPLSAEGQRQCMWICSNGLECRIRGGLSAREVSPSAVNFGIYEQVWELRQDNERIVT
jgi:hypothetical protein